MKYAFRISIFGFVLGAMLMLVAAPANAARFYFEPSSSTLSANCPSHTVRVMIDTEGQPSNAADIEIYYTPSQALISDTNEIVSGTQIGLGNAFESYRANLITGSSIFLLGSSFTQNLTGIAEFANITFVRQTNTVAFSIRYEGAGVSLDSNIAHAITNQDILSGVANASYTFANTPCPTIPDTTGPVITLENPEDGALDVPIDTNVQIRLRDTSAGVNINTLSITLDGIVYSAASSQVSVAGTPANYLVTIDPDQPLTENSRIQIEILASDLNSNPSLNVFHFNRDQEPPQTDTTPPLVSLLTPANGSYDVPLDSNISLRIADLDSGVDINSLEIVVAGISYVFGDPTVTVAGSASDYTIIINPSQNLPDNVLVPVEVNVADLAGNNALLGFSFNRADPTEDAVKTIIENPQKAVQIIFAPPEDPLGGTFLDDTPVEDIIEEVGTVGTSNIVVTSVLLFNLLSAINVLSTPGVISTIMGILFRRRRDKTWGIIFDGQTSKPVPFAAVRLFVSGTSSLIDQKVTDLNGRYGFAVEGGNYRVEVKQAEYVTTSREVVIGEDSPQQNLDIRLIPRSVVNKYNDISLIKGIWAKISPRLRRISPYLFILGLLLSLVSFTLTPNAFNTLMLLAYTFLICAYILSRIVNRAWFAAVIDSETGLFISGAMVRIYNLASDELVDTQITNLNGKFAFWGKSGQYGVIVSARGYKFPVSESSEFPLVPNKYSGMVKVNLGSGKKVVLRVEPQSNLSDTQSAIQEVRKREGYFHETQLSTPFG